MHESGLFGLAADRPVTITVVDEERKIREIIPEVRALVQEGLILLLRAELVQLLGSATTNEVMRGGGAP